MDNIRLRTYGNAWNYEKKVYSVGNLKLIRPINLTQFGYFGASMGVMYALSKVLFPFMEVHPIICYIGLPIVITRLLTRVRFHGKPTASWIKGFLEYLFIQPKRLVRWQTVKSYAKGSFTRVTFRKGATNG